MGRLCAGILSLLLVYLLNIWAFAQLVPTLLVDHQVVIVRVLLCVVLYTVLFLVLKTIILSLRILTGLPIIKGLNKLLGFVAGAAYGLLLVGILRMIQDMLPIF